MVQNEMKTAWGRGVLEDLKAIECEAMAYMERFKALQADAQKRQEEVFYAEVELGMRKSELEAEQKRLKERLSAYETNRDIMAKTAERVAMREHYLILIGNDPAFAEARKKITEETLRPLAAEYGVKIEICSDMQMEDGEGGSKIPVLTVCGARAKEVVGLPELIATGYRTVVVEELQPMRPIPQVTAVPVEDLPVTECPTNEPRGKSASADMPFTSITIPEDNENRQKKIGRSAAEPKPAKTNELK